MVVLAFVFGALLGTGLPPAPTYILVAIVIAPPMIKVGVNPWVVHFFAFFLGVWGELTPPTSIVAAVTAKIANASFYQTLGRALQICVSLFTLMAGVFVHPELVIEPGLAQIGGGAADPRRRRSASPSACRRCSPNAWRSTAHPARAGRASRWWCCCARTNGSATAACVPVLLTIGYWLLVAPGHGRPSEAEPPEPVLPCRSVPDCRHRARPDVVSVAQLRRSARRTAAARPPESARGTR